MEDDGNKVGHYFGHPIYLDEARVLRYRDNHERVPRGPSQRLCPRCGDLPTPEGHDPCIANLPGVLYACCGHGRDGYIVFEDGRTIRFSRAEVEDELPVIKTVRLKLARQRIIAALKGRAISAFRSPRDRLHSLNVRQRDHQP